MAQKYVKKPIEVEAIRLRYCDAGVKEALEFMGIAVGDDVFMDYVKRAYELGGIYIETLEGRMRASFGGGGDYIIKGINGEFYPCKPDIFEATYWSAGDKRESKSFGDMMKLHDYIVGLENDSFETWHERSVSGYLTATVSIKEKILEITGATHEVFSNDDTDAPNSIKDLHGDVVLDLCKKCGKAESEHSQPCNPLTITVHGIRGITDNEHVIPIASIEMVEPMQWDGKTYASVRTANHSVMVRETVHEIRGLIERVDPRETVINIDDHVQQGTINPTALTPGLCRVTELVKGDDQEMSMSKEKEDATQYFVETGSVTEDDFSPAVTHEVYYLGLERKPLIEVKVNVSQFQDVKSLGGDPERVLQELNNCLSNIGKIQKDEDAPVKVISNKSGNLVCDYCGKQATTLQTYSRCGQVFSVCSSECARKTEDQINHG